MYNELARMPEKANMTPGVLVVLTVASLDGRES